MKEKRKKIACLGFSANPPHLGHLLVAQQVLDFTGVDEVWLIPCFQHVFDKQLIRAEFRWEMTKMMERPKIKACDIELQRKKKSYTIDTVLALKKRYPAYQFSWIIGSDLIKDESYKKWGRWKELEQEINFWVFPRKGFVLDKPLASCFNLISSSNLVISNISSTIIRERLRKGLSIKGLVTPEVEDYIYRKLTF